MSLNPRRRNLAGDHWIWKFNGIMGIAFMIMGSILIMQGVTGDSGYHLLVAGGVQIALYSLTLVKSRVLRRALSASLVDEDARRLLRATMRARQSINERAVRERAALQLTPRRELLLATVEAELAADGVAAVRGPERE